MYYMYNVRLFVRLMSKCIKPYRSFANLCICLHGYYSFRVKHTYIKWVFFNLFTVESQYLELGYLEFCEYRSVYLKKCIVFSNYKLALVTFLQVQITPSAN